MGGQLPTEPHSPAACEVAANRSTSYSIKSGADTRFLCYKVNLDSHCHNTTIIRKRCMERKLLRALGPLDLTAIGINGVIGAGIFILPATVAQLLGTAGPLAYLFSGLVVSLIALCFAEIGSYFSIAGGPYLYAREAFGPFIGFQVGWITWLVRATSTGAVSNAFTTYLGYLWPAAAHGLTQAIILTAVLLFLMLANLLGVRYGAWLVNFFTVGKLLPLGIFIGAGIFSIQTRNLLPLNWPATQRFGEAALLLIFAYGGFEILTIPAEEVDNPRHNVPRAILATMALVTLVYVSIQLVASGTFPGLAQSKTPLASACAHFLGPLGGTLITLGALISTTGTNSGLMLVGPRLTYALAQHRQLPAVFGQVHTHFHTPYFSILFYGIVALGLTLSGSFVQLAALSAIARLVQYIATCLALLQLRKKMRPDEARFHVPFGNGIPFLCIILSLWLLFQSTLNQVVMSLGALTLGCFLYFLNFLGRHYFRRKQAPA